MSARGLIAAFLLFALFLAFPAAAYEPEVRYAELVPTDDLYVINSDFAFELGPRLEEVVVHGIPLHFVAECVITRGRWYWRDERDCRKEARVPDQLSGSDAQVPPLGSARWGVASTR